MGNTQTSRKKKKKKVAISKTRRDLTISKFGALPDDIFIKILLFDYKSLNELRLLNGHFYYLLDPTKQKINKLWENIVRKEFPLTPNKLKCKRWDIYLNYKLDKMNSIEYNEYNDHKQWFEEAINQPEWMVIEGCDYDINTINKAFKTNEYNKNELFTGKINKKKEYTTWI
eukprot:292381_1